MAPFSFMTAGVSLLAKSFTAFSCTSSLARVLPAVYINPVKCLSSQASSSPPKRPLNAYLRYVVQQKPDVVRHNPDFNLLDIIKKIAQQWRAMSPEQKRPYEEASLRAREQFRVELDRYKAQLTPVELKKQVLEKRQRLDKRKAIRRKKELNTLGKPKRPRSPFNIFMSEHFDEAKGTNMQEKLKFLVESWKKMSDHQKQVYTQLSVDDKIRYKNEMKTWEMHMMEIGRGDLVREKTISGSIKKKKKTTVKAKSTVKAKAKSKSKTSTTQKRMSKKTVTSSRKT